MVNKTAGCFKTIVIILIIKISTKKKFAKKNGKQFNVGTGLTSVQQKRQRLRLGFQSGFS